MDFYLDWRNHINIGTSETLALAGVIKQFSEMFPNIKLIIVNEVK